MSRGRFSPKIVAVILVGLFCVISLYLRIALSYDKVFTSNGIKFTGIDAYYHVRLVENLVRHFPHNITFDPYTFIHTGLMSSGPLSLIGCSPVLPYSSGWVSQVSKL